MAPPSAMAKKKTGKKKDRNHQSSVSFFDESFAVTDLVGDSSHAPLSPTGTQRVASEKLTPTPGKAPARIPRESLRNRKEVHDEGPMSPNENKRSSSPNSQGSHVTLQSNNTNPKPMPRIATSITTAPAPATNQSPNSAPRMSVYSTSTKPPPGKAPNAPARKRVSTYLRPPELTPIVSTGSTSDTDDVFEDEPNTIPSTSRTSMELPRSSAHGESKRNSTPTARAAQGVVQKIQLILLDKKNDTDMAAESTDGDSTYVTNSVGTDSVKRSSKTIISLTTDEGDEEEDSIVFEENSPLQQHRRPSQSSLRSNEPKLPAPTHGSSLVGVNVNVGSFSEERNQNSFQNSRRSSSHNHDSKSSFVSRPLVMLVEEGDEETGSAHVQEQAMKDRNKPQSDDGTASLGSFQSNRSGRSKSRSSHSSSQQPQQQQPKQKSFRSASPDNRSNESQLTALLHPSLVEAAALEKQQQQEEEGDDDLLAMAFGTEAKNRWEFWSPCILCTIMLGFWAGCIPYLVIRNNSLPPPTAITPPPAAAPFSVMIPWTGAPTVTPNTPRPTVAPTTSQDNQELLDILGSDPERNTTTTAPTLGVTNAPTPVATISNTTNTTSATPAPTRAINETTVSPEGPFNDTTVVPGTDAPTSRPSRPPSTGAPTTGLPSISPTKSPTVAPSPSIPTTMSPTVSSLPSSIPSFAPTGEDDIVFPEYTLESFNNPASPQSKAFSWMLRDPNFGTYSPSRMRQRFALATLYYSTNGDDWWRGNYTISQTTVRGGLLPWMSYVDHECDWYHQRTNDARETSNLQALFSYTSSSSGVVVCETVVQPNGVFRGFRRLLLEGVGLQGTLPQELALLTGLQELYLNHNQDLVGPLPPEWFLNDKETDQSWQSTMKKLKLQNCSLTGTIPTQISLASNLEVLDLQQNALVGSIPSEIGLMPNLQDLLWNENALTGTIPTELGAMTSALRACSWNKNLLTGTIPSEIMLIGGLEEFYVGENRLSGSIPWEFGMLRDTLVDLHLYSNRFTGVIPTRLGLLTKLRWLHVGDNQLSGPIPSELGTMTMMQLFQVENNALEGRIPAEALAAWGIVSRVWLHGNPGLSGTIPYSWCAKSPDGEVNLKNGTVLAVGTGVSGPGHSLDIRGDCNSTLVCPCSVGCSCI